MRALLYFICLPTIFLSQIVAWAHPAGSRIPGIEKVIILGPMAANSAHEEALASRIYKILRKKYGIDAKVEAPESEIELANSALNRVGKMDSLKGAIVLYCPMPVIQPFAELRQGFSRFNPIEGLGTSESQGLRPNDIWHENIFRIGLSWKVYFSGFSPQARWRMLTDAYLQKMVELRNLVENRGGSFYLVASDDPVLIGHSLILFHSHLDLLLTLFLPHVYMRAHWFRHLAEEKGINLINVEKRFGGSHLWKARYLRASKKNIRTYANHIARDLNSMVMAK